MPENATSGGGNDTAALMAALSFGIVPAKDRLIGALATVAEMLAVSFGSDPPKDKLPTPVLTVAAIEAVSLGSAPMNVTLFGAAPTVA